MTNVNAPYQLSAQALQANPLVHQRHPETEHMPAPRIPVASVDQFNQYFFDSSKLLQG